MRHRRNRKRLHSTYFIKNWLTKLTAGRAYLDEASAAVNQFGGHVLKKLGDGLMALFGFPQAQENDAERAGRRGWRRSLKSRIGRPHCGRRSAGYGSAKHPDRVQKFAAMAEKNTQLLQIIFCEMGDCRQINAVLDETLGVFAEADALKPVFDPRTAVPHNVRIISSLDS